MRNRMYKCTFTASVVAVFAGGSALAQEVQQEPRPELAVQEVRSELTLQQASPPPRAIVPRRSDRTPPGIRARKSAGPIDWAEVRRLVNETRQRDQRQLNNGQVLSAPSEIQRRSQFQPGVRPVQPEQLENFKAVNDREVARTRVPVLVPITSRTADATRIFARPNAYTAVIDLGDGARIEFIGTPMRVITPNAEITRRRFAERRRVRKRLEALDANYVISEHEQGIDLSFSKFNVAYMISIYCDKPNTDNRCTQENYITSLASSVALLNPREGDVQ